MSEKLLPCPFCGGEARTFEYDGANQATCGGKHIDCAGTDVVAPVAMWNRRTPAPEGEAVKSYGQKGRALYEAFWARNGDASPPPWDEQAHAIRAMWVNIARDAEPLYASPVVPVGVSEVLDAAAAYLKEQYGASHGLDHPVDRARILAALRPTDTGRE